MNSVAHAFLSNSPNPVFLKDMEGRYMYVNEEFERALGVSLERIRGKKDDEIFSAQQAAAFRANDLRVLQAGVAMEFEEVAQQNDGPHTSIVQKFPLTNAKGRIYATGGIVTDITQRKRTEEALQATRVELARVSRVVVMGELTASIAHEINQPLAAVVASANACSRMLATASPDLSEVRAAVANIAEAGTRASEVISRVWAFLKRGTTEKTRVDINELVREVLLLARGELHNHQVSVRTELLPGHPSVLADRIRLKQVVLNLIMNSVEAMTAVTNRPRVLRIESKAREPGNVLVVVEDSGPGIDPRNMDRIFNSFFTTKPNGMGMGLSICRSIIEAHDGRLWATSNTGEGATFQFTLPAYCDRIP